MEEYNLLFSNTGLARFPVIPNSLLKKWPPPTPENISIPS